MSVKLGLFVLLWLLGPTALLAQDLPPGIIVVQDRTAPPFELTDLDGNAYALTPDSDRWRFVHFWASWCGPCRREMPAIERMAQKIDPAQLELILVNTAEDEDTIFTFLAGVAPDLSTLMDRDGQTTEAWRPRGLPATYLVDPEGRIRYQALGGREWDEPVFMDFLRTLPVDNVAKQPQSSQE